MIFLVKVTRKQNNLKQMKQIPSWNLSGKSSYATTHSEILSFLCSASRKNMLKSQAKIAQNEPLFGNEVIADVIN